MMNRTLPVAAALVLALLAASPALAQPSAPALAQPSAPADAQKRALVARVLELQQPGIENAARLLTEQPAVQMLQQAVIAIQQRVPAERREAVARELQAEARRYAEETVPMVRQAATRLAPLTIGSVLEARFTSEELRQLIAALDAPAYRKFQQLGGDMQRALGEQLVAETRGTLEPRLRALQQSMAERINAAAAAAPAAPATPAR